MIPPWLGAGRATSPRVTPAQAGVQSFAIDVRRTRRVRAWAPAFAGEQEEGRGWQFPAQAGVQSCAVNVRRTRRMRAWAPAFAGEQEEGEGCQSPGGSRGPCPPRLTPGVIDMDPG